MEKKTYTRPPSRPAVPEKSKPKTPVPPGRPGIITGGMSVVITIGEVKITIEGPVVKVVAVLNWLFGTSQPETVISKLLLKFGEEVSVVTKKR